MPLVLERLTENKTFSEKELAVILKLVAIIQKKTYASGYDVS